METSQRFTPLGFFQMGSGITPLTTAQSFSGLTGAAFGTGAYFTTGSGVINLGANMLMLSVSGQNVRMRDDPSGIAPTAGTGVIIPTGVVFEYSGALANVQFIAQSAGSIIDMVAYKTSGVWIAAAILEQLVRIILAHGSG